MEQLNPDDRISIVATNMEASRLVLNAVPGNERQRIHEALDQLYKGDYGHEVRGLQFAYQVAQEHVIEGGNNRVILMTDFLPDPWYFGVSSYEDLYPEIDARRAQGISLSGLELVEYWERGVLRELTRIGGGNAYFVDSQWETEQAFTNELYTSPSMIAKDVRVQVEFNPEYVSFYRLIGYENGALAVKNFDERAMGLREFGAGHSVTALYEVIPHRGGPTPDVWDTGNVTYYDQSTLSIGALLGKMMRVQVRYKDPDGFLPHRIEKKVSGRVTDSATEDFYFSAAVAAFGMILSNSEYRGAAAIKDVIALAEKGKGVDLGGYRGSFIELGKTYQQQLQSSRRISQ